MTSRPKHPSILFRCDANRKIGGGHVARCLALAAHLRRLGAMVGFAVSRECLNLFPVLQQQTDLPVILVEEIGNCSMEIAKSLRPGFRFDAVILDHYGLTASDEAAYAALSRILVAIDDYPHRRHSVDILIDPTVGRCSSDYHPFVDAQTQILLGPSYAWLRDEFATFRPAALRRRRARSGHVERVIVSCGLTDPRGLTLRSVRALTECSSVRYIDVIFGPEEPILPIRLAARQAHNRVRLLRAPSEIARLFAESDFFVGAGGSTSWERCALALPGAQASIAANQNDILGGLRRRGAALSLGNASAWSHQKAVSHLVRLLSDRQALRRMSARAAAITDGRGARRTADIIMNRLGR